MASNKHRRRSQSKQLQQTRLLKRPTSFSDYAELTQYAENNVFTISRLRDENGRVSSTTLGTGFLCGPGRMLTCAHVIDSKDDSNAKHADGDVYLFVMRSAAPGFRDIYHRAFQTSILKDRTLFVDHQMDAAVIYLDESFYHDETGSLIRDPNDYLELARSEKRIGTGVGVLGYPMQSIGFTPDGSDIEMSGVLLRADAGVVNLSYKNKNGILYYDFTMAFNPGNSGGPILDIKTGEVIAYVHGYQSVPINMAKETIPEHMRENGEPVSVYTTVRALYSNGISALNLLPYEEKHDLKFRK